MKRMLPTAAVLGLVLAAPVAAQQPESLTMRQALAGGFEIKSVTFMPEDMARRAGGSNWTDGVVITLQKGTMLAFCHFTVKATLSSDAQMLGGKCVVWR
jgi:hypothetical protein